MADAPANHRMPIVLRSYTVPKMLPRYSWARKARARPLALPPGSNSSCGISRVVARLEVIRKPLMIRAAVVSSLRVLRMRPTGRSGVSPGPPLTSGITATPVSNPDRPRASFGNTSSATPTISRGLSYWPTSSRSHSTTTWGLVSTCSRATRTTTRLRLR
jgi:hypothetical protein